MRKQMSPCIIALSLLLASAGPGLNGSEKAQASKIIKRYFKEQDPAKRPAILAELEQLDHPSAADLKHFTKLCFKLVRTSGPKQKGKNPYGCTDRKFGGEYIMRVPSRAKRGSKTGIFFSLHGSGGSGPGTERHFGMPDSKLICVYPTVTNQRSGWTQPEGERFVLAIIDELKRTYRIDTNRIFVAGHSMGGFGSWHLGGKHADLFAAAGPMAGGTFGRGVVPNFRNLPLRVYNAEDDERVKPASSIRAFEQINKELRPHFGGYPAEFHLYPPKDRIGHGIPTKHGHDLRSIFQWMLKHTRNPRPDRVVWEPSLAWKRHFYWLRSEDGRGIIDVQRKGNTFTVAGGRGDLSIELDARLCDLKKPVIVKLMEDGQTNEVFNEVPKLSLRVLVESVSIRNDPEMIYLARIPVR